jgi:eukaryotic-like serine/threonine-protein kinase
VQPAFRLIIEVRRIRARSRKFGGEAYDDDGMRAGSVFEVTPMMHATGNAAVRKRLLRTVRSDREALDQLTREARFLALARHPAVPRIFEVGRDDEGPFVIEERFEGISLAVLIERHGGAVPRLLALHVARQATVALAEIHALANGDGPLELVHGDPSPDNIVLTPSGDVRFVDFGESNHRGAPLRALSQSGTPPYAAPELLRGESRPSAITDAYAIAAITIALLTSAPLRPEQEEAARLARLAERGIDLRPLEASNLSSGLKSALARLVAFDARLRPTSLSALVREIDGLSAH